MTKEETDDIINCVVNEIYRASLTSSVLTYNELLNFHWTHLVLGKRRVGLEEWGAVVSQAQTMGILCVQDGYCKLTDLGIKIARAGGWVMYNQKNKLKKILTYIPVGTIIAIFVFLFGDNILNVERGTKEATPEQLQKSQYSKDTNLKKSQTIYSVADTVPTKDSLKKP